MKRKLGILIATLTITTGATMLAGCSLLPNKKNVNIEPNQYQTEYNSIMYEQLTDNQKSAYNSLVTGMFNFKKEIETKASLSDIEVAYGAVVADHPELFFTDGYVYNEKKSFLGKSGFVVVFPNYTCTKDEYSALMEQVATKATDVVASIDKNGSQYDISEGLYKAVINSVTYDKNVDANQTIVSSFLKNKAACGGYSQAYSFLMQQFGIPCTTVSGTVDDQNHMWNVSIIDGELFLSDLTNGDSTLFDIKGNEVEYVNYSYLNMNPMFTSNYIQDEKYSKFEFKSLSANYYVNHGAYFESYNKDQLSSAIISAKESGLTRITIAFGSADTLRFAENDLFTNRSIQSILGNVNVNYTENTNMFTLTLLL